MFWFSLQILFETFLILRKKQPDDIINSHRYSCKVPVILVRLYWNLYFLDWFSKKYSQVSNFTKFLPVGVQLFPAGGRTEYGQTDTTKSTVTFRNFCEGSCKTCFSYKHQRLALCRKGIVYRENITSHTQTGPRWRSWLRHCATSHKVAGSIPDGVIGIFHWHNPSGRTMALGSTQPLTEMSTGNISWG